MRRGTIAMLVVVGVIVLAGLFVFGSFRSTQNQLVSKQEAVHKAWSDVDADLQRRADLIPNLVETVKGFTKEESTVFGDIANARAGMLNAQGPAGKIDASNKMDSALGRLHRKPPQGFTAGIQQAAPGVQHVRAPVPQQHLGEHAGLPHGRSVFPCQ